MPRHQISLALSAVHFTSVSEIASYFFSCANSGSTTESGCKNETAFSSGTQSLCLVPEA